MQNTWNTKYNARGRERLSNGEEQKHKNFENAVSNTIIIKKDIYEIN